MNSTGETVMDILLYGDPNDDAWVDDLGSSAGRLRQMSAAVHLREALIVSIQTPCLILWKAPIQPLGPKY